MPMPPVYRGRPAYLVFDHLFPSIYILSRCISISPPRRLVGKINRFASTGTFSGGEAAGLRLFYEPGDVLPHQL